MLLFCSFIDIQTASIFGRLTAHHGSNLDIQKKLMQLEPEKITDAELNYFLFLLGVHVGFESTPLPNGSLV